VGEHVTVIARDVGGETVVPVTRVSVPTFWQPLRVHAFDRASARAASMPAAGAFDVVHGFSRTRHQDLYRAGGGSHADYLRRNHHCAGQAARRFSPRHRILLAIEQSVFADVRQRIQCSSRLVADELVSKQGVSQDRIFLLPNGVDLARFGAGRHRDAGRRLRALEDPHPEAGPLWLFPGSGWHRKGLARLMDALARDPGAGHRVWIAGRDRPGPWERRAARLGISSRVRFLGPRRDLEVLYQAVDGVVLPTRYDPFANVTLEAAAAGRPVVTSSANGAAEWLGDEIRVVENFDDPGELAAALDEFASPGHRRSVGEALARQTIGLGWDRHVESLREEYQHIAARRSQAQQR
jgi:UDP-glucose:(heptosyl)LPS alpha-1,3-glucosyltransferase